MNKTPTSKENTPDFVYETCLLLVAHFRNIIQFSEKGFGFNTRIFSHILHPEKEFVYAGQSKNVNTETPTHPEHVVPCATLITECQRLIRAGTLSDEEIATLLQKHWKLATITKEEQGILDLKLGHKSTMPANWDFETGDTFARLKEAGIVLIPQ